MASIHFGTDIFEGEILKGSWRSGCLCDFVCFVRLVGEHGVNHRQEQADLESSPVAHGWVYDGLCSFHHSRNPPASPKSPKTWLTLTTICRKMLAVNPLKRTPADVGQLRSLNQKNNFFVEITMQICKTMTAV